MKNTHRRGGLSWQASHFVTPKMLTIALLLPGGLLGGFGGDADRVSSSNNVNGGMSVCALAEDVRQTVLGNATAAIKPSTCLWSATLPPSIPGKAASTSLKADDIDAASDTVRFSNVFSSSMVLQRNKPIQFWGFGTPLPGMTVCLGLDCIPATFATQQLEHGGRSWSVILPARNATTTSMTLTLRGADNATLQKLCDIVVGDVYLFSGQSNIDIPQTYGRCER